MLLKLLSGSDMLVKKRTTSPTTASGLRLLATPTSPPCMYGAYDTSMSYDSPPPAAPSCLAPPGPAPPPAPLVVVLVLLVRVLTLELEPEANPVPTVKSSSVYKFLSVCSC